MMVPKGLVHRCDQFFKEAMASSLAVLEKLFRIECHSLAQYVTESWPWVHRGDRAAQDLVSSITVDERRWAGQLFELLNQKGVTPRSGCYPAEFTHSNLHFVALDYLLLRIADYIERSIGVLRAALPALVDDPQGQALVGQMIERKTGQVDALRKVARSEKEKVHA